MSVRHAYGRTKLTPERARTLAGEIAAQIAELYDDDGLESQAHALLSGQLAGVAPPKPVGTCCEFQAAMRLVSTRVAQELVGWGFVAGQPGALGACARWKVERMSMALIAHEEMDVDRGPLPDGEEPDEGMRVLEIEATP